MTVEEAGSGKNQACSSSSAPHQGECQRTTPRTVTSHHERSRNYSQDSNVPTRQRRGGFSRNACQLEFAHPTKIVDKQHNFVLSGALSGKKTSLFTPGQEEIEQCLNELAERRDGGDTFKPGFIVYAHS